MISTCTPSFRPQVEALEDRQLLATYYVATTGNNSNTGLSDGAAFATLQRAADQVQAGDTVIVRAGTYVGFDIRNKDGTATQRITFDADPGVLINVRNNRTDDGINIEGVDYVTIRDFQVNGIGRTGIRTVLNTGVWLLNNKCDSNGRWGILTGFSNNLRIEGNETSRSVAEHGIYVSNSCVNPIVRSNHSWGNRACGLHFNGDLSLGGTGVITGALVENNIIHDNGVGGGSGINMDGVQSSTIRNNLLYNNHASGISLYRIDAGGGSINNLIVNNTVIVASDGRWALNIRDGSTGNRAFNNIFWNNHSSRGAISVWSDSLAGFKSDFNVVIGRFTLTDGNTVINLSQWRQQTGSDVSSFTSTPDELFVNPGANDYHLRAGSPAIDRGLKRRGITPSTDFEGQTRGAPNGYDIGADEWLAGGGQFQSATFGGASLRRASDEFFASLAPLLKRK